ncbi:ABC transporter substrate-binding protein [Ectothiorhodospira haloalkaliphila]|uniref:ABC transporter substrate-binding protein n=1 Tax=Ectothiorhodospira haloalkaliphila TaxID=421628 RepID=UPI001EE8F1DD|nr:ABC transporter substrate-binding protein [Ectothiorhodospira haloalkaliphila]MCG5526114.1 ABC transporter substrate-binding protein [Ectothiorhodospira haloalkaliphila]
MIAGNHAPESSRLKIVAFTPTTADNTYWPELHTVLHAVTADLEIDLEIHEFSVLDRFAKVSAGVGRLTTEPLPDAAIFSVEFGQASRLMKAAEKMGIPFFLNGPLFPEELAEIGKIPGRDYKYWAGYFHEDEERKGYLLAQELIAAAREANAGEADTIQVAGINGSRSWYGSIQREAGLRRAVDEHPDVRLVQMVYTQWAPEEGRRMASRILRRYPEISVLWAASDQLAIGAAEAIDHHPADDGPVVLTGGLDLSHAGIDAVLKGELVATVACTSLLWAQVMIDLHDHLRGLDPVSDSSSALLSEPIVADRATAEDIRAWIRSFGSIDFRRYSRFHHGKDVPRLCETKGDG